MAERFQRSLPDDLSHEKEFFVEDLENPPAGPFQLDYQLGEPAPSEYWYPYGSLPTRLIPSALEIVFRVSDDTELLKVFSPAMRRRIRKIRTELSMAKRLLDLYLYSSDEEIATVTAQLIQSQGLTDTNPLHDLLNDKLTEISSHLDKELVFGLIRVIQDSFSKSRTGNHPYSELLRSFLHQGEDFHARFVTNLTFEGVPVPVPQQVVMVSSPESKWDVVQMMAPEGSKAELVVHVPDKFSSTLDQGLAALYVFFSRNKDFARPIQDEDEIYTLMNNSMRTEVLFAITERWIAHFYIELDRLASFIEWCQMYRQTLAIAGMLRTQYLDSVERELDRLAYGFGEASPFSRLAGSYLPKFETPAKRKRQTGDVSFEAHVKEIEKTKLRRNRSLNDLIANCRRIWLEPLNNKTGLSRSYWK